MSGVFMGSRIVTTGPVLGGANGAMARVPPPPGAPHHRPPEGEPKKIMGKNVIWALGLPMIDFWWGALVSPSFFVGALCGRGLFYVS